MLRVDFFSKQLGITLQILFILHDNEGILLTYFFQKCKHHFAEWRFTIFLLLGFTIAVGSTLWHVSILQDKLVLTIALNNAQQYANALTEFRTLYASEVVQKVLSQGIEVTHDYELKIHAVPLPATITILLGKKIGARGTGEDVRLYSPYPFPGRVAESGLRDTFAVRAWNTLRIKPDQPFYQLDNQNGRPLLRYAIADQMRESCVHCHNNHPDSVKRDWKVGDVRGVLEVTFPMDNAIRLTKANLRSTFFWMTGFSLLGAFTIGIVISKLQKYAADLNQEITERKQAEAQIRRMAQHDVLTQLPNRALFDDLFRQSLAHARRNHEPLALMFIDLDKFKQINDAHGHTMGDAILMEAAQRMQSSIRDSDTAARVGGDEFVISLQNIKGEKEALMIAEKIRDALNQPFELLGEKFVISTSIGVALFPEDGEDESVLYQNADLAMYYAKKSGRNNVQMYRALLNARNA